MKKTAITDTRLDQGTNDWSAPRRTEIRDQADRSNGWEAPFKTEVRVASSDAV